MRPRSSVFLFSPSSQLEKYSVFYSSCINTVEEALIIATFPDIRKHPDFVSPQSKAWNEQLAAETGKYEFTWKQDFEGPPAEDALTEKLAAIVHGKVLDVGCGHGSYMNQWADRAEEVVGFDLTAGYLETANRSRKPNVRYVQGNTKDGKLPFPDDYFDIAYTKKGPTSWYREGNRIVRSGGTLLLYHPGDGHGGELSSYFPGLFAPSGKGAPTLLDLYEERLEASGLQIVELTKLQETMWLPTAEDVLSMLCFGQRESYKAYVRESCYAQLAQRFEKHATARGIRTTGSYYLIEATPGRRQIG
ncbi:class I SAM-dependent methyltransferase [Paenibacillus silvisoli]|uniref:class I SAM-dependent methyltransferase n=1 Tax=Paenibacillus silvisoli TaxID=3110539 RepID=UPI002805DCE5|nr:methyltransferase domain-containing protein [Paenibacillus silvisoli]